MKQAAYTTRASSIAGLTKLSDDVEYTGQTSANGVATESPGSDAWSDSVGSCARPPKVAQTSANQTDKVPASQADKQEGGLASDQTVQFVAESKGGEHVAAMGVGTNKAHQNHQKKADLKQRAFTPKAVSHQSEAATKAGNRLSELTWNRADSVCKEHLLLLVRAAIAGMPAKGHLGAALDIADFLISSYPISKLPTRQLDAVVNEILEVAATIQGLEGEDQQRQCLEHAANLEWGSR